MENGKRINRQQLAAYFKKKGTSMDTLFDQNKMFRYTENGQKILVDGIEHFTDWNITASGAFEFRHPDYPEGRMLYAQVETINDIQSANHYIETLNKLRDTEYFLDMVEQIVEKAELIELGEKIDSFLKEKHKTDLESLIRTKDGQKRNDQLNKIFKEFAGAQVHDGNIHFIDPLENEQQFTKRGSYELSTLQDKEQILNLIQGTKGVRDLHFGLGSNHVKQGRGVSKRQMNIVLRDYGSDGIEKVIKGTGLSEKERTERLEVVHLHLSEVSRDKENDMVFPHPNNPAKKIVIRDLKNQERYFEDIKSLEEFMNKVKYARDQRDTYYHAYENVKEDMGKRVEKLKKKDRDSEELER